MERIVDSHAHLNEERFLGHTKEILDRAKEFGIEKVLIPSWDIESSKKAIEIAEEFENVYAAVSIHAQDVGPFVLKDLDTIKCLAKSSKKVIAIGETGLDYHYGKEDALKQKEFFIAQLDIARELNLPVIIHLRDAAGDYLDLIKEYSASRNIKTIRGVMHSYSDSLETMKALLKYGFYISFSGPVTFKNARIQKECALNCPLDRILVETDSPYLSPEPFRGTTNEPKNAYYTLKYIAELRNIDVSELAKITTNNFKKLFNLED